VRTMNFLRSQFERIPLSRRAVLLLAGLVPLLLLFLYAALRSGPLAPIPVTVRPVQNMSIAPALFGVGSLEARSTFRIGPTTPGRVKRVMVQVGDHVKAGQWIAEMERADLDLIATQAEQDFIRQQVGSPPANQALVLPSANLRLLSPVSGLVIARNVEPGTTAVAGQAVVEIIDPNAIWINARFDQVSSSGLRAGLPARITMRSRSTHSEGRVLRVEPVADPITEEVLAKIVFDQTPSPLPPLGELAEITVTLPALEPGPAVLNASLHRIDGQMGVWVVENNELRFAPVLPGAADLDGMVQIKEGLKTGQTIVVHSRTGLGARSRIEIVDRLPGQPP
jgi:HlyD family secretion protein